MMELALQVWEVYKVVAALFLLYMLIVAAVKGVVPGRDWGNAAVSAFLISIVVFIFVLAIYVFSFA